MDGECERCFAKEHDRECRTNEPVDSPTGTANPINVYSNYNELISL